MFDDKKLHEDTLLITSFTPGIFVLITLFSIKHVDIDIKSMGVLPRMGVLPHLTLLFSTWRPRSSVINETMFSFTLIPARKLKLNKNYHVTFFFIY